jgi:peptide/nickel transport system substrate-binding protein
MTDFRELDPFRKKADPLQLDLVESFAKGKINRRHFIQRGTVLGLSLASLSAIVAACGGSSSGGGGAAATDSGIGGGGGETTAVAKAGGTMKWAMSIPGSEGVNPITMIDLVTYNMTAMCFEYLVRSASDLSVVPQLATEWKATKADATEWTFSLREGVTWQDGTPFTSKDVVATYDNLLEAGNSALNGIVDKGGVSAPDDLTVVFTLAKSNGHFPYLVSSDNSQSQITPAGWTVEDNLEPGKNLGTGPWKLTELDVKQGATFVRNDTWWGGKTLLDEIKFIFIQDTAAQIAAVQSGDADGVPQFPSSLGQILLDNSNMNIIELESATHRQVWMRCDDGPVVDPKVREAIALTFDREKMVSKLLGGHGAVANDHVMFSLYPYFNESAAPQRTQDIAKAKQMLADAGVTNLTLDYIQGEEIPNLAVLVADGLKQAGVDTKLIGADYGTFYGKYWCPSEPAKPPCAGATPFGIVDYGHRGTPDVYLNAALSTGGVWNSSQYSDSAFDTAFANWSAAVSLEDQTTTAGVLEENLLANTPIGIPYTINTLCAYSKQYQGVINTAMGFTFLEVTSQV